MATYAQIAQQTFSFGREDGSTRAIRLTFEAKSGGAQDYAIPITGKLILQHGAASDAPNKPFKVSQANFTLKGTDEPLIAAIAAAGEREVRLTVEDTELGKEYFRGYVVQAPVEASLYEGTQELKVRCTGALVDLGGQLAPDTIVEPTVAEHGADIGEALDLPRPVDVYTTLHPSGKSTSDLLPLQLRYNLLKAGGNNTGDDPTSKLDSLLSIMSALGWQCFQLNGRLVFADIYERFAHPDALNTYEADGESYSSTSVDISLQLDRDNVIRGAKTKQLTPVVRLNNNFKLITRDAVSFEDPSPVEIFTNETSQEFTGDHGYAAGGEKILLSFSGQLISQNNATVSGGYSYLMFYAEDVNSGEKYYYDPAADAWDKDNEHAWNGSFNFFATGNPEQDFFSEDTRVLEPLPDGVLASLHVAFALDIDLQTGDMADIDRIRLESLEVRVPGSDKVTAITHRYSAYSEDTLGDVLSAATYIGDVEFYTDDQAFSFNSSGVMWEKTTGWVSETGNGTLPEIVSKRLGSVLLGRGISFTLQLRDLDEVSLLTVASIEDNAGNTRKALPVVIKHDVFAGFFEVTFREAFAGFAGQDDRYTSDNDASGTGSALGSGNINPGGGGGDGVIDHGKLLGLGDDDHPQYFNQTRGDARYVRPNTTPSFDQVVLNNPASSDNHALRAGQVLQASAPLSGGGKLRAGLDLKLNYNSTDFKIEGGSLRTAQRIDTNAEMQLKSLLLKTGLTIDDVLGYIKSEDLSGYDFISQGFGVKKNEDGDWQGVIDSLTVRKRAKFFELLFEDIQVFAKFLLNEGNKVDEAEQVATADWSFSDTTKNVFAANATDENGLAYAFSKQYKCYVDKNTRVQLGTGDLAQREAFSGNEVGLTQAYINDVEQGSANITDNSPRRWFRAAIVSGTAPQPGQTFARLGNLTDTTRQGGIYFAGSGEGAPHSFMYDGVDSFAKFGAPETIKDFRGNTQGRVFPDFPELDGNQGRLYANVTQNGFFFGNIRSRSAFIGDENRNLRYDPDIGLIITGTLRQRTPSSDPAPDPLYLGQWNQNTTYYAGDVVKVGSSQPVQYILSADTSTYDNPASSSKWEVFVESGEQGEKGDIGSTGPKGDDGTSVSILGTLDNSGQLPASGNTKGDGYLINGDLYVWDGSQWNNVGQIQGPKGDTGPTGDDGQPGPGIIFRGAWDSSATYYGFAERVDVVFYNNEYWLVDSYTGTSGSSSLGTPTSSNSNWRTFGAQLDSVATRLLLAGDATFTRTVTLGTSDPNNPNAGNNGILQSSNFSPGQAGFRLQASGGKIEAYNIDIAGTIQATEHRTHVTGDLYMDQDDGGNPGRLVFPKHPVSGNRGNVSGEGITLPYDQEFRIAVSPTSGIEYLYRVKAHKTDGYTEIFSDPDWGVQENFRKYFEPTEVDVYSGNYSSVPAPDGQLLVLNGHGTGYCKFDRIDPKDGNAWEKIIIYNNSSDLIIRFQNINNTVTSATGNIYMHGVDSDIYPHQFMTFMRDDLPAAYAHYSLPQAIPV